MILFDVAPGPVEIGIGLAFFVGILFIFAAIALIAFKMLKRTLKMSFRIAIVALILFIGVIGAISFLTFGFKRERQLPPRPPAGKSR